MSASGVQVYVQELEQEPFDVSDFVERLAWRLTGGEPAIPMDLHKAFEQEIQNLQFLNDHYQQKIVKLMNNCREEEEEYFGALERLENANQTAFDELKRLDKKISGVSTKVVHLGDQLQSINVPRARAAESLALMRYFNEFLNTDQPLESEVFNDPDRTLEAAEITHKLNTIAMELPPEKFKDVQERILQQYEKFEGMLIVEFERLFRHANVAKMHQIASIMSQFKGSGLLHEKYVEMCQVGAYHRRDIFADIQQLFKDQNQLIQEVFPNPNQVMGKLVEDAFRRKLRDYITSQMAEVEKDSEAFLQRMFELCSKTNKLAEATAVYPLGSDKDLLPSLVRDLFSKYQDAYIEKELKFLKDHCKAILQRYYDSKGHIKKPLGGFQDLKRELAARMTVPETYGGETFLSEEVAISILQETKHAFQRCQLLSPENSAAENVEFIFDVLLQFLGQEHIDYAVELGMYSIPYSDPKTPPPIHFLSIVRQANAICHLLEKQFEDSIMPIVKGTAHYGSCEGKKRAALFQVESRLGNGLDRLITAVIGYVRHLLYTEQKKTDFRPENEDGIMRMCSPACSVVVKYFSEQVDRFRDVLDGSNLEACFSELGLRFHRAIVEHIYQFQYNSTGAVLLILDVTEYKKYAGTFKISMVIKLFEVLLSLCNLLVVVRDNIEQAKSSDLLADVDHQTVANFIQLRTDYKTGKLYDTYR